MTFITGDLPRPVKWLLIFDNVDSIEALKQYWPTGCHGSVIVTTRNPNVARFYGITHFEVPVFTREQSIRFLFDINATAERTDALEHQTADAIAARLGELPLALDQTGSYANSTSISYRVFLRHYLDFDQRLLFEDTLSNKLPTYQMSIKTTWTMRLAQMDSNARELMETLVLMDPDGVPLEFFESCSSDDK